MENKFKFSINQKVIIKALIVTITAAYTVEAKRYYAVNKYPGYLIHEDLIVPFGKESVVQR